MTLTKRIIPCLDIKNGRVVKGLQFGSIKDAGDPVKLAAKYSDDGADELVFLDITASDQRREIVRDLVRDVASVIDIPFTVGGGINSLEDARNILLNGADKIGINTGAIKNPTVITDLMKLFGRQCIVVAIDAKRNYDARAHAQNDNDAKYNEINLIRDDTVDDNDNNTRRQFWFEVFIYGGKRGTGVDAISWASQAARLGAGEILLTSIDRDGTKDGYDTILTRRIVDSVPVPVIASGGCGVPRHMADIFRETDVDAALAASIFHYDTHGVRTVKSYLHDQGIAVRL